MLVYAAVLHFDCEVAHAEQIICKWISRKLRIPIQRFPLHIKRNDAEFRTFSQRGGDQTLIWMSFTHPDAEASARLWRTEIGLRYHKVNRVLDCTITLETVGESAQLAAPIELARPFIVRSLLYHCNPISPTPGMALLEMDENDALDWLHYIEDRKRDHPIVLISPKEDGSYVIAPQHLLSNYLGGLADVVAIAPQANSFKIRESLGERYAVWRGAINVILPPLRNDSEDAPLEISTKRISLQELEDLEIFPDLKPEVELLAIVTQHMNLANHARHISLDYVRQEMRRQHLRHHKEAAAATEPAETPDQTDQADQAAIAEVVDTAESVEAETPSQGYTRLLEADTEDKSTEIARLSAVISQLREELEAARAEVRAPVPAPAPASAPLPSSAPLPAASVSEIDHWIAPAPPAPPALPSAVGISAELRARLVRAMQGTSSVEESLLIFEELFPERLALLPRALKSAHESQEFRYKDRAFQLLLKFVTEYWEALNSGKAEIIARRIFGDAFAGYDTDSDRGERNWRANELQTFTYKGEKVRMTKHLRIGFKDNAQDSLRIHFHWDALDHKLVIAHCGRILTPR